MPIHLARWLACISLLVVLVAGCGKPGKPSSGLQTVSKATSTSAASPAHEESTASFTLTGGVNASYTLRAALPTSKLRHGHREFTINIMNAGVSLFIVFYGYQGPGSYTLANAVNGGDIHIGLQNDERAWDLLMQPAASCSLSVASETPTSSAGVDRLQGSFACPRLFSSAPAHPQQPVTLKSGSFDLAIVVES